MSGSGRWLLVVLGAVTLLAAAKSHGRQVRLERELAGYFQVTFGAKNPDFVEALWRRDRLVYWGIAAALLLASLVLRFAGTRRSALLLGGDGAFAGGLSLHVGVPLLGAFTVAGLTSLLRFLGAARRQEPAPDWLGAAVWGSAGWWALTLGLSLLLVVLAKR